MALKKSRNCVSLKIPSARLGRRHCNGCSQMIAWLRRCRIFTTKNSSSNSPRHQSVRRLQQTTWRRLRNSTLRISESRNRHRSSRARWSWREQRHRRVRADWHLAAMGSGERAGKRASFNGAVEGNGGRVTVAALYERRTNQCRRSQTAATANLTRLPPPQVRPDEFLVGRERGAASG